MSYPISDVTRRVVYSGSAGTGPYSFSFEVLVNTDIAVYKNTTLLTLTTDYTVTINSNGTGSVTLVSAATGSDNITLVGDRSIERATDFVTGGDLFANTLNTEFDSLVIFSQQVYETANRGLKAPITDPTDVNMVLPVKASRKGKVLAFDSTTGNPVNGPALDSLVTVIEQSDNINTVADNIADVNTVADDIADVSTVAGIAGNVTTVAGIAANVTTVAGVDTEVTTVAGISADVSAVADIAADVSAVENIAANVTTVAGISSNVTTVAGISANVTTVAGVSADVTTVATDIADVSTCADNMAAILDAPAQASAAAASAAAAAASLDNFDDRYLGSKSSAPTLDNDGNALVAGALYFNDGTIVTDDKGMYVYDGGTWIAASAASQAILVKYKYTATAGQTTFSGSDANSLTLSYTAGSIIVTLNGVVMDAADYTATSGNSVVLGVAASLNDELGVFAFSTFDIANTYTQAQVDAFAVKLTGAQTVAGVKTFSSKPVLSAGADINGATVNTNANWGAYINPKSGGAVGDFTITDPTGNFGRLNIDGSGRVTMPYQPCLVAINTSSKTVSGSASLQFDSISLNRGSAIVASISNSRFTVPITGYYLFATSMFMSSINDSAMDLRVNGVTNAFRFGSNLTGVTGTASNLGTSVSVPLSLSAGDYIEIFGTGSVKTIYSGSPVHTQMSLTLIG